MVKNGAGPPLAREDQSLDFPRESIAQGLPDLSYNPRYVGVTFPIG